MAFFGIKDIKIEAVSCAVPDNLVPVQSFEPVFGAEACEKFTESTGIREMYKALPLRIFLRRQRRIAVKSAPLFL